MRNVALPFLLVLSLLPTTALAAPAAPDKSKGVFYDEGFAQQVEGGRFDPFRFWTGEPRTVVLEGKGRLKYTLGLEWESCTFQAKPGEATGQEPKAAATFAIQGKCKAGGEESDPIDGTWEVLEDGRARVRLSPHHSALVLKRIDKPYAKLVAEYEAAFAKRWATELAGAWAHKDGDLVEVTPAGAIKRKGRPAAGRIVECLVMNDTEAPPRTACLLLAAKAEGRPEALAFDEKKKELVPGVLVFDELNPDGRAFEPKADAARYWRK